MRIIGLPSLNAARHRRMLARVEWTRDSACRSFSGSDRWDLLSMPEYDPAPRAHPLNGRAIRSQPELRRSWTAVARVRRESFKHARAVRLWCAAPENLVGLPSAARHSCDRVWLARQPTPPEGQ